MDKYTRNYILNYWDKRYPIIDGVAQVDEEISIIDRIEKLFGIKGNAVGKLWEHWLDTRLSIESHPIHFIRTNDTFYFWSPKKIRDKDKILYHRDDGPAVIFSDGRVNYYIKGKYIPKHLVKYYF